MRQSAGEEFPGDLGREWLTEHRLGCCRGPRKVEDERGAIVVAGSGPGAGPPAWQERQSRPWPRTPRVPQLMVKGARGLTGA
jgi:hypothetical protein